MRHDRRAAVGGNDEGRAESLRRAAGIRRFDTDDAAALDQDVRHAHTLPEVDRKRSQPIREQVVERLARDGERVVPVRPPPADRAIATRHDGAVRSRDAHAGEGHGTRGVERFEDAEPIEHPRRFGAQVLAAQFRPRKRRAVEHHHLEPALGKEEGAGRARRTGADHDDVAHEATIRTRASQGTREITMRTRRAFSASTESSLTE